MCSVAINAAPQKKQKIIIAMLRVFILLAFGAIQEKNVPKSFDSGTFCIKINTGSYNLALIAFDSSSYPGLSKRANIFFL